MLVLAHGHGTRIKLIISISVGVILSSALVHATGQKQLILKCTREDERFKWSAVYHFGNCSNIQPILVTHVFAYDENCITPIAANEMTTKEMGRICNGKPECTISELDTGSCGSNACYLLYFTCALHTEETASRATTDRGYTDKDVTSTQHSGTNEHTETDNTSVDMHLVIIVVVIVLAFVATVFATTLCLLVFCCQKSPLYRRRTISHRTAQQQHQPEYDDVAENECQTLTPSVGDNARHHGVFCDSAPVPTTNREYENTITPDHNEYEEISSNKSPAPAKRTISASQISPSLSTISLQSDLLKSTRSNSRSPQLADKHSSLPSQQDRHTRSPLETPVEYTNTLLSSEKSYF